MDGKDAAPPVGTTHNTRYQKKKISNNTAACTTPLTSKVTRQQFIKSKGTVTSKVTNSSVSANIITVPANNITSSPHMKPLHDTWAPIIIKDSNVYSLGNNDEQNLVLINNLLPQTSQARLLSEVQEKVDLEQFSVHNAEGESVPQHRRSAWYGPCDYYNNGIVMPANDPYDFAALPEILAFMESTIEGTKGLELEADSFGINYYESGSDSSVPLSEDIPLIMQSHPISLLSLGRTRWMDIREIGSDTIIASIELKPGSVLIMLSGFQQKYLYNICCDSNHTSPTVTITFTKCDQDYLKTKQKAVLDTPSRSQFISSQCHKTPANTYPIHKIIPAQTQTSPSLPSPAPPNQPHILSLSLKTLKSAVGRMKKDVLSGELIRHDLSTKGNCIDKRQRLIDHLSSTSQSDSSSTITPPPANEISNNSTFICNSIAVLETAIADLASDVKRNNAFVESAFLEKPEKTHPKSPKNSPVPQKLNDIDLRLEHLEDAVTSLKVEISTTNECLSRVSYRTQHIYDATSQTLQYCKSKSTYTNTTPATNPPSPQLTGPSSCVNQESHTIEPPNSSQSTITKSMTNLPAPQTIPSIVFHPSNPFHHMYQPITSAPANQLPPVLPPSDFQPSQPTNLHEPAEDTTIPTSPCYSSILQSEPNHPQPKIQSTTTTTTKPTVHKKLRTMVIGDSQLHNRFNSKTFSSTLDSKFLYAGSYRNLINNRMRDVLKAPGVDCYVLQLGINDLRYDRFEDEVRHQDPVLAAAECIETLLQTCKSAKIAVSLPTPTPGERMKAINTRVEQFNNALNKWIYNRRDQSSDIRGKLFVINNISFKTCKEIGKPCPYKEDMLHVNEYGFKKLCLNIKYGIFNAFRIPIPQNSNKRQL